MSPADSPPEARSSCHFAGKLARIARSVQDLQKQPGFIDVYTGSILSQYSETLHAITPSLPHAHPGPLPRWSGPRGFGARHINDAFPFYLWEHDNQRYRFPSRDEIKYLIDLYQATSVEYADCLFTVRTPSPPKPVPLTLAGVPAIFVPPAYPRLDLIGAAPYVDPRRSDPCPELAWPKGDSPKKVQALEIISVLEKILNVQRVYFFSTYIVVELVYGDGRLYDISSLPSKIAGMPTTYHHEASSFLTSVELYMRERVINPKDIPFNSNIPPPQDDTNYLQTPDWNILCPGIRVSAGHIGSSERSAGSSISTTCGIQLRKNDDSCVTVANHGFIGETEVFHPSPNGDKIGTIVDRYPELDIAMVKLAPVSPTRFTNKTYFEAEPPRRLVEVEQMPAQTWYEIDSMSTGLMQFLYIGSFWEKPLRPIGHPPIPAPQWRVNTIMRVFGATSPDLLSGMCGAPFVEVNTGNVAGFFHQGSGELAVCAALDDLVAEGWEIA